MEEEVEEPMLSKLGKRERAREARLLRLLEGEEEDSFLRERGDAVANIFRRCRGLGKTLPSSSPFSSIIGEGKSMIVYSDEDSKNSVCFDNSVVPK